MTLKQRIAKQLAEHRQNEEHILRRIRAMYYDAQTTASKEVLASIAEYEIESLDDLNRILTRKEANSLLSEVVAAIVLLQGLRGEVEENRIRTRYVDSYIREVQAVERQAQRTVRGQGARLMVGRAVDFRIDAITSELAVRTNVQLQKDLFNLYKSEAKQPVFAIDSRDSDIPPQNETPLMIEDKIAQAAIDRQLEFAERRRVREIKIADNFRSNEIISEGYSTLNEKWLGVSYDERIHIIKLEISRAAHRAIHQGIALGRNPQDIARDVVKEFGDLYSSESDKYGTVRYSRKKQEDGTYRYVRDPEGAWSKNGMGGFKRGDGGAYAKALRVARTEFNYVANQAALDRYERLDIRQYIFVAEVDDRVSEICSTLNDVSFDVDSAEVGVNYPPMHPNCRSTTVAVTDLDELDEETENEIDNAAETATINTGGDGGVIKVGELNPEHFKDTFELLTSEIIITDAQIAHIKERHPNDYERFAEYIPKILSEPDYIIEANKPNSAVLLKDVIEDGEHFQLVLRLRTAQDPDEYQNSVITFLKISKSRYESYLRNKKVLYKSE